MCVTGAMRIAPVTAGQYIKQLKLQRGGRQVKIRHIVALESKWQHGGYVQSRLPAQPSHNGSPTVANSTMHVSHHN